MEKYIYIGTSLFFVILVVIWLISTYNNFQGFIIRINEAETNIDSALRKKYDLLSKAISIIKSITDLENVLDKINDLKNVKITNFELDRKLCELMLEYHYLKEEYPKLKNNEEFIKLDINLSESELDVSALSSYYNDIISEYNKQVKAFPSNIVALLLRYNVKPYYDGKNLFSNKKDSFKL